MKNISNLVLAFAFGIATLAACEKVAVPKVSPISTVSGPTTELEKMGAVNAKSSPSVAAPETAIAVAVATVTTKTTPPVTAKKKVASQRCGGCRDRKSGDERAARAVP